MGSAASAPLNVDALRSPPPPPPTPRYLVDSCPAAPAPLPAETETTALNEAPEENVNVNGQGEEVTSADIPPEGVAVEGGFDGACAPARAHTEGVPEPNPGLGTGPNQGTDRGPDPGPDPGQDPGLLPPNDEALSAKRTRPVEEEDDPEHEESALKKLRIQELREAGVASEDAGFAALAAEVNVGSRDAGGEATDVTVAPTGAGVAAGSGGVISPDTLEPVTHHAGMADDAAFSPNVLASAAPQPLDDSPSFQAAFQGFTAVSALDTGATIAEGVEAVSNGVASSSPAPATVAPAPVPASEDPTAPFNTMASMWAVTLPTSSALGVDSPLMHIPAGGGGAAPLTAAPVEVSHPPPPLPPPPPPVLGSNTGGGGGGGGDAPLMPVEAPVVCDASSHLGFFAANRSMLPPPPLQPSTLMTMPVPVPMPILMSMPMPMPTSMPTPPPPAATVSVPLSGPMYGRTVADSPCSIAESVVAAGAPPCDATAHGALPTPYDFLPIPAHQLLHTGSVSDAAAAAAAAVAAAATTFVPAAAAATVATVGKVGTSHSYSRDPTASAPGTVSTGSALLQLPPPPPPPPRPLEQPEPTVLGGGLDGVISNPPLMASPFLFSSDGSSSYTPSATGGSAPKARTRRTRCDEAGGETSRKVRNRPTCVTDGCRRRPLFGVDGTRQARCCSSHKEPGMVNVLCRLCEVGGCKHQPSFGVLGSRAMRCSSHKLEGMVNVAAQRCLSPGCRVVPSFGKQSTKKPTVCAAHRQEGDVDLVTRRCHHEGCVHRPVFGHPSENKAYYCASHKVEGMVNVFAPRCEFPACLHQPSWGLPGAKKPTHCAKHRSQQHENKR